MRRIDDKFRLPKLLKLNNITELDCMCWWVDTAIPLKMHRC